MRKKIRHQPYLVSSWGNHPRAKDYEAISSILDRNPDIRDRVHKDLVRADVDPNTGREALTADLVLRALIVKQMNGFSYATLAFHLEDSSTFRIFCGLGISADTPSKSALQRNIKALRAETLEEINRIFVADADGRGVETGSKVRIDTTVTGTNIHSPSDSSLLWDCVRVLARLMVHAAKLVELSFQNHRKSAKHWWLVVGNARSEADRKVGYEKLIALTERTMGYAKEAIGVLETGKLRPGQRRRKALRLAEKLKKYIGRAEKIVDQTRRRVLQGESVPSPEKLVSIFESHTDIIVKDRRETLYGHKVSLTTGKSGLILDCVVESGNPPDSSLAVPMVERVASLFGTPPRQVAMDGGFASRQNLHDLKAMGVEDVCFAKARGLEVTEMVKDTRVFRALRRFRAGIESAISWLKRVFGLDRCTWQGFDSFKAYVWSSVLANNLLVLARRSRA